MVAVAQHMTTNNLHMFQEDTRLGSRDAEPHATPELPDVTPIPDTTVSSGLEMETFPQELTNYMEEVSNQRIHSIVYISGSNSRSQQARVT